MASAHADHQEGGEQILDDAGKFTVQIDSELADCCHGHDGFAGLV
jgi:hypothetical protein